MAALDVHEVALPRELTFLGQWTESELRLKVYGIASACEVFGPSLLDEARATFGEMTHGAGSTSGGSARLGFAIVHPGTEGISFLMHWWEQGSVLCQSVRRRSYDGTAIDVAARGVIGCVWELAVIDAEQRAWRSTMMQGRPDADAYMAAVFEAARV